MSEQSPAEDTREGYADALPEYAERVLEVAERIPPGHVMTYGDVAEWLDGETDETEGIDETGQTHETGARGRQGAPAGGRRRVGPRQVGRVMSLYGSAVPWWRVVRADGVLLPGHELRALAHYRAEGTPLKEAARSAEGHVPRLDMRRARWDGDAGVEGHT
ncbi:MGMT family protein [Streptomyces sp. IBSBF 3136]|uniref:MGMT family protein n=1 Tax=Streptomyces sp. IBSBF 3136 TaxID=2903524 RepID=UPI002FDC214D